MRHALPGATTRRDVPVFGMDLFPRTPQGVAYTLLIIIGGPGLLSATLHLSRLSDIEQRFAGGIRGGVRHLRPAFANELFAA